MIVGGGLTGCAIAYVLAKAGHDVVLLEAGRLAAGSTAGSLGIIAPQPDARFRSVEELAGRRPARAGWEEGQRAAVDFAKTIGKLGIKCDLTPAPLIVNARTAEDVDALRREQAARKAAGIPTPVLNATAARAALQSDSAAALRMKDGFIYDPVRAALGFAAAAKAAGAQLFERSLVRRTRFTRKYADVILGTGSIRTRAVIVATGEPGTLFGQLRRHVRVETGFAVVTEPLNAAMRREMPREALIATELDGWPLVRPLPDQRVLFAGAPAPALKPRAADKILRQRTAELMYQLSVRYPAISGLPAGWGWSIPVVSSPDRLPWIGLHRNYPFHFFAMAMGWHGDSLAWWAAKSALRFLRGEHRAEDDALGFARHLG